MPDLRPKIGRISSPETGFRPGNEPKNQRNWSLARPIRGGRRSKSRSLRANSKFTDYVGIAVDYCERVVAKKATGEPLDDPGLQTLPEDAGTGHEGEGAVLLGDAHVADVCSFMEKLPSSTESGIRRRSCSSRARCSGLRRSSASAGAIPARDSCAMCCFRAEKNAKSALVAGISLYCLTCEGEVGPQIRIGAATLEQTGHVFEPARKMIRVDRTLGRFLASGDRRGIFCGMRSGGDIKTITSIAAAQDGHNPHVVVLRRASRSEARSVSGDGFRVRRAEEPADVQDHDCRPHGRRSVLGTAEEGRTAPPRAVCGSERIRDHLRRGQGRPRPLFRSRDGHQANPMYGVSVQEEVVRERDQEGWNDPSTRAEYLRTRLNVWSNAAEALIQIEDWDRCEDQKMTLAQFEGQKCWLGVDLASKRDMAAVALIFELPKDGLAVFSRFYVPDDAPGFTDPDLQVTYEEWDREGKLIKTGPGIIDQNRIRETSSRTAGCSMWK